MQRLEIIGHLGNDAEVKDLGQNQVINFSVAVSETYTNKTTNEKITKTTWFECAKWGNNTAVAQYLKKGQQVFISGTPIARAWQKEDGTLVSVLGVNVLSLQLLGSSKSEATAPSTVANTPQAPAPPEEEHDDLPF